MRRKWGVIALIALVISGCAAEDTAPTLAANDQSGAGATFDTLTAVSDINAMLPQEFRDSGLLRVGVAPRYPPAEFLDRNAANVLSGYTIDIVNAVGIIAGVDIEYVNTPYPSLLSELGSSFDIAASSLSVTPERLERANMVTYVVLGSSFVVQRSPKEPLPPEFPCGASIGVLADSDQQSLLDSVTRDCVEKKLDPPTITVSENQDQLFRDVRLGTILATVADSDSATYAVTNSHGYLEVKGSPSTPQLQGIAIPPNDEQLTVAMQAALQYLIDNGYLQAILDSYELGDIGLSQSTINPRVS